MESTIISYFQESELSDLRETKENRNVVYHRINEKNKFSFKFHLSDEPEANYYSIKEDIYLRAISNLIKKTEFLKLYIEVVSGQITDKEYEEELMNNSEDYFVEIGPICSSFEYQSLIDIIRKIPRKKLTVNDFSDIFGISQGEICKAIK